MSADAVVSGMSDALVREIINNTGLSPGTVMTASNIGQVTTAFGEGRVSGAALSYAQSIQGQQLPDPDAGGGEDGGDGGGGGDPSPPPDPDESRLEPRIEYIKTPGFNQLTVAWAVENVVTSGSGEQLSDTINISIDGQTEERESVSVSAGGLVGRISRFNGVEGGTREVCVDGDCQTATVSERAPDESALSVTLDDITRGDQDPVFSGGRQSALVSFTVDNQITSGDGARRTADVEITVDGQRVETVSVSTAPGGSSSATADIRGLTPGSRRVCVGLQ